MAKPGLAEALGGYADESGEHGGDDTAVYVADLADALGLKDEKAQKLYDVLCAIVESKMHSHGGGKGLTLILE